MRGVGKAEEKGRVNYRRGRENKEGDFRQETEGFRPNWLPRFCKKEEGRGEGEGRRLDRKRGK